MQRKEDFFLTKADCLLCFTVPNARYLDRSIAMVVQLLISTGFFKLYYHYIYIIIEFIMILNGLSHSAKQFLLPNSPLCLFPENHSFLH